MSVAPPLLFVWNDTDACFRPAGTGWLARARKHYANGESYELVEHHKRSTATHNHFFSCVHESWQNLPAEMATQFPTEDHLRKWALIKAGFYHSDAITCASKAEAQRVAAFIRPTDEFALITVMGSTVTRYRAQSQSLKAMGKATFAASKDAVLDILAGMVGVPVATLATNAGKSA